MSSYVKKLRKNTRIDLYYVYGWSDRFGFFGAKAKDFTKQTENFSNDTHLEWEGSDGEHYIGKSIGINKQKWRYNNG